MIKVRELQIDKYLFLNKILDTQCMQCPEESIQCNTCDTKKAQLELRNMLIELKNRKKDIEDLNKIIVKNDKHIRKHHDQEQNRHTQEKERQEKKRQEEERHEYGDELEQFKRERYCKVYDDKFINPSSFIEPAPMIGPTPIIPYGVDEDDPITRVYRNSYVDDKTSIDKEQEFNNDAEKEYSESYNYSDTFDSLDIPATKKDP